MFTVIGAAFAYHIYGVGLLIIILAGIVTTVSGGILLENIVNQTPLVLVEENMLVAVVSA
uniref:Putative UPF0126 domain protein n=1 Tax=uncultured marine crenarchaeote HF4000_APKG3E18 TaxID=455585 RepID=B3T7G8_9ARCH|nr:putative UPF0126 domain protein [uncultured marine crenarchaeote HF4000_APKG3E18]